MLAKLLCHIILWLIPLLFKACHYQLHYISPLIYIDKKAPADQSVTRYCGFFMPVDNELLRNENTGREMRYFFSSKGSPCCSSLASLHCSPCRHSSFCCVGFLAFCCCRRVPFTYSNHCVTLNGRLWSSRNSSLVRLHAHRQKVSFGLHSVKDEGSNQHKSVQR